MWFSLWNASENVEWNWSDFGALYNPGSIQQGNKKTQKTQLLLTSCFWLRALSLTLSQVLSASVSSLLLAGSFPRVLLSFCPYLHQAPSSPRPFLDATPGFSHSPTLCLVFLFFFLRPPARCLWGPVATSLVSALLRSPSLHIFWILYHGTWCWRWPCTIHCRHGPNAIQVSSSLPRAVPSPVKIP